jgi:hypothetical protein
MKKLMAPAALCAAAAFAAPDAANAYVYQCGPLTLTAEASSQSIQFGSNSWVNNQADGQGGFWHVHVTPSAISASELYRSQEAGGFTFLVSGVFTNAMSGEIFLFDARTGNYSFHQCRKTDSNPG